MSRTKAINEKCKDCIYDTAVPGSWRAQVEACTSERSCALWPYRPLTIETLHKRRIPIVEEDAAEEEYIDLSNDDADIIGEEEP